MPIEIKELHIKINVNDGAQTNAAPNKESGASDSQLLEKVLEQCAAADRRKKER